MSITQQQLLQILPNARPVAGVFVSALNQAMARFDITSPVRQAAFVAQVGHESQHLTKLSESLYYKDPVRVAGLFKYGFDLNRNGKVDAAEVADAQGYLRNSEKMGNRVYANRMGNGPEASGDGYRYRARGCIGITGRDMYRRCGQALGLSLVDRPELLELPENAALSAAWFWSMKGLNTLADQSDFVRITRRINGGLTGQEDRQALYDQALKVLA